MKSQEWLGPNLNKLVTNHIRPFLLEDDVDAVKQFTVTL